jgi:hypothetical protein
MSKSREYDKLLDIARARFRSVRHQTGDFRGGAWISPDGKQLLINRMLPLDERIELLRKLLQLESGPETTEQLEHDQ